MPLLEPTEAPAYKEMTSLGSTDTRPCLGESVAVMFAEFGPYHVARVDALAARLALRGMSVSAVRFRHRSRIYDWSDCECAVAENYTLAQDRSFASVWDFDVVTSWVRFLFARRPVAVLMPSYWPMANASCFVAAKSFGAKCIMMNESWSGTERAGVLGRLVKRALVRCFDAALVGGALQKEHFARLGIPPERIAIGYDVVENEFFERASAEARESGRPSGLPRRFFLNVGRMVPKKNLEGLVRSYAYLAKNNPQLEHALVLVGDGSSRRAVADTAVEHGLRVIEHHTISAADGESEASGPRVVMYSFSQIDQLPLFYAFATVFVLPSHREEWGLVVNEAMASGLPVLVSDKAGCAPELVQEGRNGFTFAPSDCEKLAAYLERFASDPMMARRFGAESQKIVEAFGPERFAQGACETLKWSGITV